MDHNVAESSLNNRLLVEIIRSLRAMILYINKERKKPEIRTITRRPGGLIITNVAIGLNWSFLASGRRYLSQSNCDQVVGKSNLNHRRLISTDRSAAWTGAPRFFGGGVYGTIMIIVVIVRFIIEREVLNSLLEHPLRMLIC